MFCLRSKMTTSTSASTLISSVPELEAFFLHSVLPAHSTWISRGIVLADMGLSLPSPPLLSNGSRGRAFGSWPNLSFNLFDASWKVPELELRQLHASSGREWALACACRELDVVISSTSQSYSDIAIINNYFVLII